MNIAEEFETYFVQWKKQNYPNVNIQNGGKYWSMAMQDFLKEFLPEKYEQVKQSYLDMEFKKQGDVVKEDIEPKKESDWEKVQKIISELS